MKRFNFSAGTSKIILQFFHPFKFLVFSDCMKFILIVTDESTEKTKYFGPFDDGEAALDWGLEHFDDNYILMSTTVYDPKGEKK